MTDQRSDMELLHEYAELGTEKAFATLVSRHLALVYHAALRQTRRPEVAEEITQTVFTLLARKAARISSGTVIAGWLVKTARFVAICAIRDDARRRRREEEASRMRLDDNDSDFSDGMENILPVLDELLIKLRSADRDALVLRYLEGKSYDEVARGLGASEEAARKRVQRALERLRGLLGRKGIPIGSAALASAFGSISGEELPAGLAPATIGARAAAQATGAAKASSLVQISLRAMKATQWKIVAAFVLGALFVSLSAKVALNHRAPDRAAGTKTLSESKRPMPPVFAGLSAPAAPLAVATRTVSLRVVDEKGAPIPEAYADFSGGVMQIFSEGVEGLPRGVRFLAQMNEIEDRTQADAKGVIDLKIPAQRLDAAKAIAIVAPVRAPGYVFADPKITLAKPEPVVMKRGETLVVKVSGVKERSKHPFALVAKYQSDKRSALEWGLTWTRPSEGTLETRLPKESYVIMGVNSIGDDLQFSPVRILQAEGMGTKEVELRTAPGRHVYGRLDDSVPRPVQGGRVIACALAPALEDPEVKAGWETSGDIAADGTFDLGAMPAGELKIVAYCPGYVSLPDLGRSVVLVTPQGFSAGSKMPLVVRMIRDGRLNVTVRDINGRPVAGAEITMSITQNLDGFSASRYRGSGPGTMEILQNRENSDAPPLGSLLKIGLRETTNAQGVATLDSLPVFQGRIYASAPGLERICKERVPIGSGDNSLEVVLKPAAAPHR